MWGVIDLVVLWLGQFYFALTMRTVGMVTLSGSGSGCLAYSITLCMFVLLIEFTLGKNFIGFNESLTS